MLYSGIDWDDMYYRVMEKIRSFIISHLSISESHVGPVNWLNLYIKYSFRKINTQKSGRLQPHSTEYCVVATGHFFHFFIFDAEKNCISWHFSLPQFLRGYRRPYKLMCSISFVVRWYPLCAESNHRYTRWTDIGIDHLPTMVLQCDTP